MERPSSGRGEPGTQVPSSGVHSRRAKRAADHRGLPCLESLSGHDLRFELASARPLNGVEVLRPLTPGNALPE
eukprot:6416168-Lingulodinium_polyedra.AAC.1